MNSTENNNMNKEPPDENAELDLQWAELTDDWQNQLYQKTDIEKLIKQTKRRVLIGKFSLVFDLICTLALIVYFIILLFSDESDVATLYYLGFGSIVASAFCVHTVKFRIKGWRQLSNSPDQALVNAIANCKSSIKYFQLCKLSCYLLLPAANWYSYQISTLAEKSVWPPLLFINVFVGLVWGISEYMIRKRKNELIRLKAL